MLAVDRLDLHQFIISDYSADIDHLIGVDEEKLQRSSALFLLKLKEHRRISQVGIDNIVQGATGLFYQVSDRLQAGIRAKLAEAGIDFEAIHGLNDLFKDIPNPFGGIETCSLQENYYRKNLGLIVSLSIVIVFIMQQTALKFRQLFFSPEGREFRLY